ncbi:NU1M oxidoreductase, partial [Acromyrmex insinuator]
MLLERKIWGIFKSVVFIVYKSNYIYYIFRRISQTLSYEVSLIIIQIYVWYRIMVMHLFLIFLLRIIAELNHRPIDFVEGESELVSGFNIEYFRGGFALIFMAKYGMNMIVY